MSKRDEPTRRIVRSYPYSAHEHERQHRDDGTKFTKPSLAKRKAKARAKRRR